MKSNELFEKIHSGEIKENTNIEVMTEEGKHIAFINYKNSMLNWSSGEFDTRYLCDINTEFKILKKEWEVEKIDLSKKLYAGDRITLLENKMNEIIDEINKLKEPLLF